MNITAFVADAVEFGNWWVRRASNALNEHSPPVNRTKNGNSLLG